MSEFKKSSLHTNNDPENLKFKGTINLSNGWGFQLDKGLIDMIDITATSTGVVTGTYSLEIIELYK